jgi:hypothetical protein
MQRRAGIVDAGQGTTFTPQIVYGSEQIEAAKKIQCAQRRRHARKVAAKKKKEMQMIMGTKRDIDMDMAFDHM